MNRWGVEGLMEGSRREISIICGVVVAAVLCVPGGMNVPDSRNGFTLDMLRRAEAEGERRMMGKDREGLCGVRELEDGFPGGWGGMEE